jgi:mitochondrial cardiolipin hydrolase
MQTQELEQLIINSLEDFTLDQDEKYLFKNLSETISGDKLSFIRNKAFELSRSYMKAGGVDAVRVLNWLERLIKAIQTDQSSFSIKSSAYFSPGDSCRNRIISLMDGARKTVNICLFTISDNKITSAILDAHNRDVEVIIISDNDKANDKGSDIDYLSSKGVPVILDRSRYHMHHKFAIFDNKILLNGSFNWTRSASDVNEENILVTSDNDLLPIYIEEFKKLKIKLESSD